MAVPGSGETWMAFLGPDTSALGEREMSEPMTESQVPATLAALLGEDYDAAVPKAGRPILEVLRKDVPGNDIHENDVLGDQNQLARK
jgi:hypothetical protein